MELSSFLYCDIDKQQALIKWKCSVANTWSSRTCSCFRFYFDLSHLFFIRLLTQNLIIWLNLLEPVCSRPGQPVNSQKEFPWMRFFVEILGVGRIMIGLACLIQTRSPYYYHYLKLFNNCGGEMQRMSRNISFLKTWISIFDFSNNEIFIFLNKQLSFNDSDDVDNSSIIIRRWQALVHICHFYMIIDLGSCRIWTATRRIFLLNCLTFPNSVSV